MPNVWPASLPQSFFLGTSIGFADNAIRTEMDTGPAKQRRRFTAAPEPVRTTIRIAESALVVLRDFHDNTCEGGTLPFDWTHPVTDAAQEFRFTAAPSARILAGGDTSATRVWEVDLALEAIP